jgi:hypothetical protein
VIFCRRMVREDTEHRQRVERARRGRKDYERKQAKTPPEDPTRKALPKRPPATPPGGASGMASGTPPGGAPGTAHGTASGVPTGPPTPISIERTTKNPPTPLSPSAGEKGDSRKPSRRHEAELAAAAAIARGGA